MSAVASSLNSNSVSTSYHDDCAVFSFRGDWLSSTPKQSIAAVRNLIFSSLKNCKRVQIDLEQVKSWDGALYALLYTLHQDLTKKELKVEWSDCPAGLERLLRLSLAVPKRQQEASGKKKGFFEVVGIWASKNLASLNDILSFIGENVFALFQFVRGQASVRKGDLREVLADVGPLALPIVTLISVLVGIIFAFIGAIQLRQFGAQIYVANLVGIAMTREMGAVMVGIIMSGRTGAAFAAQIGTMQVNEEIDALKTLGISPMEFLVLPRTIALVIMMPLLCIYSDLGGMFGGMLVSGAALDISFLQYFNQTLSAVTLTDVWIGIVKSVVFGILIAWCGCYQGIKCGRSSSSVGLAATSAVVAGIVSLVLVDAVFAVGCNILHL